MVTIDIDYEVEEKIVRASLMETMASLKQFIDEALAVEGPLSDSTRADLIDEVGVLTAAQQVAKWYTVHTEHEAIDAFDVDIDAVRAKLAEQEIDWDEIAVDAEAFANVDLDLSEFGEQGIVDLKIDPEAL